MGSALKNGETEVFTAAVQNGLTCRRHNRNRRKFFWLAAAGGNIYG